MQILEIVQNVVTTILGGYLAMSGWVAGHIETLFGLNESIEVQVSEEKQELEQETPSAEELEKDIEELPSKYELGGAIPQILIDNAAYQRAAVTDALSTSSPKKPKKPLKEHLADALVNIYCTLETDTKKRATTGSGVFIDKRGVILTNAHVAQFLLLENTSVTHETTCIVRAGNPATPQYEADLLYISPLWVQENANLISKEKPSGTGERDYALLYISRAFEGATPGTFPSLQPNVELVSKKISTEKVFAGGYPAEILLQEGVNATLQSKVASTSIVDFYTFGSQYADLITIANSPLGEQGSSGGPVVKEDGSVVGLIVTRGNTEKHGPHSLRALTLSYIDRTITEETGFGLFETLTGDLARRGQIFKEALSPFLSDRLNEELVLGTVE